MKGYDYNKFKLFHLSLLWRASISTISYGNNVNSGTELEEEIRQLILQDDAGNENKFLMFGRLLKNECNTLEDGFVGKFQYARIEKLDCFYIVFLGCEWTYYMNNEHDDLFKTLSNATPRRSGDDMLLPIIEWQQANTVKIFNQQRSQSIK